MKSRALSMFGLTIASLCVIGGCSSTPNGGSGGSGGNGGNGGAGGGGDGGSGGGSNACVNPAKMDLILAIDNSRSMADKQEILSRAVPDLVQGLVNPPCYDPTGAEPPSQPADPAEACPAGLVRTFVPMTDIHFGVISSSIGGHGSDACPNVDPTAKECQPDPNLTNNDKAHLLDRADHCNQATVPTYDNKKFLAWDPGQVKSPPGESEVSDGMGGGLAPRLRDLVLGVGQIGCGYESQLESIYRFLVDPEPYETITANNGIATPTGTDTSLLQQRTEFLRPDSLVAVVMLTDENDCSTKEYGQFYAVNKLREGATPWRMPRARQECATNPNDPCCLSCAVDQGQCSPDPTCSQNNGFLTDIEDNINLRCWDQKRRFGIDFMYPIDRYTQAFTSATIANRSGDLVPNPLFSDLNPNDDNTQVRGPQQVLVTGIVGVPWQDIARDKNDISKGFKNAAELAGPITGVNASTWDVIIGDPANYVAPLDPLMIETHKKRNGTNPITGDVNVDSTMPLANPINGHETTIPTQDDLQYACIFPLLPGTERDCTDTNLTACDCTDKNNDNPLCQPDPNNGNSPTLQVRAKAYPGIRPLMLLESLGDQAVVGSICPAQLNDPSQLSFGYRPVVRSVVDWLTRRSCPVQQP
ncbi:MAG: hypothetical protein IPM54_30920 [Polyangiaceae bacterium]|nr:hypothetical protein [Polyangiaceae bacterium]